MIDLYTPWADSVGESPWQVYPRPQMKRESYVNLNGLWDFTVSESADAPADYDRQILVPFCPESALSGLKMAVKPGSWLHYRRSFTLPEGFRKDRVLIHFGGVDQVAAVYVNGVSVGIHTGGYTAFSVDITEVLQEENELTVAVLDDLRAKTLPYGKQSLSRGGMWYTPVSGIWQTVWLESVPCAHIEALDIQVTLQSATVSVTPALSGAVILEGKRYPLTRGRAELRPENPHLWTPEDPFLYAFVIETENDRVESYFALRTLEVKTYNNIPRLCLNGEPYFFHGLLDQGYWSDGIYTPPTPEAYAYDIAEMKRLGFNTLRKHIKVEPEQFYYDCDRLGMVVFQDMVNNGEYSFFRDTALPTIGLQRISDVRLNRDQQTRTAFLKTMEETVAQLKNHPCICYWTIFNEGWGQFDSEKAYEMLKALDSSRFIDATSGWFRQKKTDVDSRHIYFTPWSTLKASDKPLVLSEFGGYAYGVKEHLFNPGKAFGYKACRSEASFQTAVAELYVTRVLPAVERGLCAAIYTQVSDVEDEINGMLTYDRRVNKADPEAMQQIASALQEAFAASCTATLHQD